MKILTLALTLATATVFAFDATDAAKLKTLKAAGSNAEIITLCETALKTPANVPAEYRRTVVSGHVMAMIRTGAIKTVADADKQIAADVAALKLTNAKDISTLTIIVQSDARTPWFSPLMNEEQFYAWGKTITVDNYGGAKAFFLTLTKAPNPTAEDFAKAGQYFETYNSGWNYVWLINTNCKDPEIQFAGFQRVILGKWTNAETISMALEGLLDNAEKYDSAKVKDLLQKANRKYIRLLIKDKTTWEPIIQTIQTALSAY